MECTYPLAPCTQQSVGTVPPAKRNDLAMPCLIGQTCQLHVEYDDWWNRPLPDLTEEITLQKYWDSLKGVYTELYKYAMFVLGTPPSTADVEENFSILQLVDDMRGPNIKTDLVEARTLLRCNNDYALLNLPVPLPKTRNPAKRSRPADDEDLYEALRED